MRAARVLARHLRVCFEQYLMGNSLYRREHAIAYLRSHIPKRPDQPMGFGIQRTADGDELTDLIPAVVKSLTTGDMDGLITHLESRWQTAQPAPIVPTPGKEPSLAPKLSTRASHDTAAWQSLQPKAHSAVPSCARKRVHPRLGLLPYLHQNLSGTGKPHHPAR